MSNHQDYFKNWDKKKRKASDELLRRGYVRHLFVGSQKKVYDLWHGLANKEELGITLARKSGKTFMSMLLAFEFCWKNPNKIVRYVAPTLKSAREIVIPIYNEFRQFMPNELMPRLLKQELKLVFSNNSAICLGGALPENVESNRGSICDVLILDEVAFFSAKENNFNYLLMSVLFPQLTVSAFGKVLYITTPAKNINHPYPQEIVPKLIAKGNYHTYTIFENNLLSDEDRELIIERYGGRDSKDFRREYLCEPVSDTSLLCTPEFNYQKHVINEVSNNRGRYQCYVSVDTGLTDLTVCIWGYFDYIDRILYILGEKAIIRPVIPEIAELIKYGQEQIKEYALDVNHTLTIVDAFPIVANTLRVDHNLSFNNPIKRRVVDTIALTRKWLSDDTIKVHNSCKQLIYDLQNAVWEESDTNEETRKIERNSQGHSDALMTLAYMVRAVNVYYIPKKGETWTL